MGLKGLSYYSIPSAIVVLATLAGCGGGGGSKSDAQNTPPPVAETPSPPLSPGLFVDPTIVEIVGYHGHAMEPDISPDGLTLFFNNLNSGSLPDGPENDTNVHYATKIDDYTFQYMGLVIGASEDSIPGVNELEGVPSISGGILYFIRTTDYLNESSPNYLKSIFMGRYANGNVVDVRSIPNLKQDRAPGASPVVGEVTFDVDIHVEGQRLYFSEGLFSGDPFPDAADIGMARQLNGVWVVREDSLEMMRNINTGSLEYAPSISDDRTELFFTRAIVTDSGIDFGVYMSTRASVNDRWPQAERITAIAGDVTEAPSINTGGDLLYYHAKINNVFSVLAVSRKFSD